MPASSKSIIYYTSNREDQEFEKKIRENILKQTNLSIISVSQKPINFGKNICVGDVGLSYINERKQILIGLKEAKTDYVIMCESDFLYPKEYFEFDPEGADTYRYDNVWIIWKDRYGKARRKKSSEGAMIVKRKYFIKELERLLKDYPDWVDEYVKIEPLKEHKMFHGEIPCISFKTGDGVRKNTNYLQNYKKLDVLPYWGSVKKLKKKYLWN